MSEIEKINQMYSQYMTDKKKKESKINKMEKDYIITNENVTTLIEVK